MFSKFVKIKTDNPDLDDVQQNVARVLDPLYTVPIHDGIYLRDISLSAGFNRVLHKLERNYIGFIVCNTKPVARFDTQSTPALITGSWQTFVPQITGNAGMTWTTTTLHLARYRVNGSTVEVQLAADGTTGGVASAFLIVTPPVPMKNYGSTNTPYTAILTVDSGNRIGIAGPEHAANRIVVYREATTPNWNLGAGKFFGFSLIYEAADAYAYDGSIIEAVSDDPSVSLNLVCNSAMTASILVY